MAGVRMSEGVITLSRVNENSDGSPTLRMVSDACRKHIDNFGRQAEFIVIEDLAWYYLFSGCSHFLGSEFKHRVTHL